MTVFLLTQEILGLYFLFCYTSIVLLYQYSVTKPFVFMFRQPFVKGYSHKRTESSISV